MGRRLSLQKCESCAGLPPLSAEEIDGFLKDPEVEGWTLNQSSGIARIDKTFKFQSMRIAD